MNSKETKKDCATFTLSTQNNNHMYTYLESISIPRHTKIMSTFYAHEQLLIEYYLNLLATEPTKVTITATVPFIENESKSFHN